MMSARRQLSLAFLSPSLFCNYCAEFVEVACSRGPSSWQRCMFQKWMSGLSEADQNPLPGTEDWEQERAHDFVGAGPGAREPGEVGGPKGCLVDWRGRGK